MNLQEPETVAIGYHGTRSDFADAIEAEGFKVSRNPYDWLGDGVYFFQHAPRRAWEWAFERFGSQGAVVGAEIRLSECMDLLDVGWNDVLSDAHDEYVRLLGASGRSIPTQSTGAHPLDREVINYTVGVLNEIGIPIACVRAAFREGRPVYPDSALYNRAHIQIAVRDSENCIKRIWRQPEALLGR